jgi:subtilase family serine protease
VSIIYSKKGNVLLVGNKKVLFNYTIRYVENVNNILIVLLEIPYNDTYLDNVFGVSNTGEIKWRIENVGKSCSVLNQLPFENLNVRGNNVSVSDFYGRRYFLNPITGKILSSDIVK